MASLGIQSLVQQGATQGKTAHKLMDALKDTDILHWKHSLSELIEISLAQTTSIWRMYGKRSGSSLCHRNTQLPLLLTFDCILTLQLLNHSYQIKSVKWLKCLMLYAWINSINSNSMDSQTSPTQVRLFKCRKTWVFFVSN